MISTACDRLSAFDVVCALSLFFAVVIVTIPGLGSLEFFRHTEADRALIGWEMWESGDWVIPHLLGDKYLTKPPLYYQLLALAFSLFGGVSEVSVRSVSVAAGALLAGTLYLLGRAAGLGREDATGASVVLSTTGLYATQTPLAELDMTYTLFTTLSLLCGYLSIGLPARASWACAAHGFGALAFLTKGPPVLAFYGLGFVWFLFLEGRAMRPLDRRRYLVSNLTAQLCAVPIGVLLFLAWYIPFSLREPVESLDREFTQEVVQRFIADPKAGPRHRGLTFYLTSVPVGFLPWTLIIFPWAARRRMGCPSTASPALSRLSLYAAAVIVPSLVVFSLASGKSSRYLLPLFPLLAVVAVYGIRSVSLERARALRSVGSVPRALLLVFALAVAVCGARLWLYVPARNGARSVKPAVVEIRARIPAGEPLFVLELFPRWVLYYLKQEGVVSLRLTPTRAEELARRNSTGSSWLLLDAGLEGWRLAQLTEAGGRYERVLETQTPKDALLLLRVSNADLFRFGPHEEFPTDPSFPYPGLTVLPGRAD